MSELVAGDLQQRDLQQRCAVATGPGLFGAVGVIGGGLVSAVTGPLSWEHGSWAAAYLVLVVGVAQLGLGIGQAWLAEALPGRGRLTAQLVGWNLGSALVIVGTVVAQPGLVDAGSVLLVVALVLFIAAGWVPRSTAEPAAVWGRRAYLLVAIVVLVSIPVGAVLAALGGD